MSLSRDDVEKVALLARLKLTEAEVDALTGELQSVLQYVDQLAQVDTDGIEPMAHAVELQNVLREDAVEPSLPRSEALANAPKHNDAGYLVPAVLGD